MKLRSRFRAVVRQGPTWAVRAVSCFVLVALLAPQAMAPLAGIGHGLYHLSERMSLEYLLHGHSHIHMAGADHDRADNGLHGPFDHEHTPVHVHGPVTSASNAGDPETGIPAGHGHNAAVDLLLSATGLTIDAELTVPPQAQPTLDLHLPTELMGSASGIRTAALVIETAAGAVPRADSSPELPPPRA